MNEDSDLANVHRHYVNAERGDEGIPDHFKKRLDNNPQNELLQEAVFRELWYSDDTIHSLRSLESIFDNNRQTISDRLDEMVEQGILKKGSINNGDYWWIKFPDSKHPLPRDIVVHPEPGSEEMSVNEFFDQTHVIIGAVALLATAVGGAMVLLGAFQTTGNTILGIPVEELLRLGVLTLLASYIFLLLAVVMWIISRSIVSKNSEIRSILGQD
ncbi:hypothetical protein [Halorubrum sp. LN27]|uniref:hypothetical protein n=1 Tax=Halorubrum sp. LN27 TaxID=2801032 RepID=UPI00190B556C|nr:hypothetical protein [Halorubrum sp. LN27]